MNWNAPLEVDWSDDLKEVDAELGIEPNLEILFVWEDCPLINGRTVYFLNNGLVEYPSADNSVCNLRKLPVWTSQDGTKYAHSGLMSESHRRNLPPYWERYYGKDSPEYQFWMIWLSESPKLYQQFSH